MFFSRSASTLLGQMWEKTKMGKIGECLVCARITYKFACLSGFLVRGGGAVCMRMHMFINVSP